MKQKCNSFYHWIKLQRRYRGVQARWVTHQEARLKRKLDILGRRLHSLNRKWKIGIAASALTGWLAAMPVEMVSAQDSGFPAVLSMPGLDGSNGFKLSSLASDSRSTIFASAAGDINGDGVDDIIVGSPRSSSYGRFSGSSYVVFGNRDGFSPTLDLSTLDGSIGFRITGARSYDVAGLAVSSAGDMNGDGIDDLMVAAPFADPSQIRSGTTFIVFGSREEFPASLALSSLEEGDGFKIDGIDRDDRSGYSIDEAGDINGDGINDIIIGAKYADPNGQNSGAAYVVFGSTDGFTDELELSSLDGSNGFAVHGLTGSDEAGFAVSAAGDMNGDGLDDFVIAAPFADPNENDRSGASYVIFGSRNEFPDTLELSVLDGSNGFMINGAATDDRSGYSISHAGDVNNDGVDDLIIGAPAIGAYDNSAGSCYVVYGSRDGFPSVLELSTLDRNNGFILNGVSANDYTGRSVHGAGDINGDGIGDVIIGAWGADPGENEGAGSAYVVFGRNNGFDRPLDLSSLNGNNGFVLNGIADGEGFGRSVSAAGDVNGDGVDDVIIGAHKENDSPSSAYVIFGIAAPRLSVAIPDQSANPVEPFTFRVPDNTFSDQTRGEVLVLSAQLASGENLPSWLNFDPDSNTFTGTPSPNDSGTITIVLTATDQKQLSVSDEFELTINVITSIEGDTNRNIELYPNPVADRLHLAFSEGSTGNIQVHVRNLEGQVLLKEDIVSPGKRSSLDLDVSMLNTGMYLVEIHNENEGVLSRQRIIKR